jgi:hypothetical protein
MLQTILAAHFPLSSLGAIFKASITQGRCSGQSAVVRPTLMASFQWAHSIMPLLWGWKAVVVL